MEPGTIEPTGKGQGAMIMDKRELRSMGFVDPGSLPWDAAAIVLWLLDGEEPSGSDHFSCDAQLHPPQCNPVACWDLGQAVEHAGTSDADHGKRPWIKVGKAVLSPTDVLRSFDFYKHHGTRK